MKRTRKTIHIKKTKSWYRQEIERLDRLIDKIRAARFGYPYRGRQ